MQIPKSFLTRLLVVVALLSSGLMPAVAQIKFILLPVTAGSEMTEEAAKVVTRKIEQVLARSSAAARSEGDGYAVRAELSVTGEAHSSGLVRNVTSATGELTLTALNTADGTLYHSVTVPLKAALKSTGGNQVILALAKAIKPTDAVYTRFVRVARERIAAIVSEEMKTDPERPDESDNPKKPDPE